MKTAIVFVFLPLETAPELFKERLHECIAALDKPHPAELAEQDPAPFWTWFISNPRPQNATTKNRAI